MVAGRWTIGRHLRRPRRTARRASHEILGRGDQLLYRVGVRSAHRLRLPDFLGIGAQKSASTWLHANLSAHPDLYLPPEKELHHFDWFEVATLKRYASMFEPAGDRRAGEITPGYSALPRRDIRWIRRIVPQVRLVLVLRDPVERAWSQAMMDLARARGRPAADIPVREYLAYFDSSGVRRRGDYSRMLDEWTSIFPPEQLWIGFYEDVASRPVAMLAEVFAHLGVDAPQDWSSFPVAQAFNAGSRPPMPDAVRAALVARYADDIRRLGRRYPSRVGSWASR